MSGKSKIEWTDKVWNPVTGCTPVSPGCDNCYAERMTKRLQAMGLEKYKDGFKATEHSCEFDRPFHWKKPYRVFVCSMGDLFHDSVTNEFIAAVFGVMAANPHLTFQVLTKRPSDMFAWFEWAKNRVHTDSSPAVGCLVELEIILGYKAFDVPIPWPLPNVHIGVTAENQEMADRRIPLLLQCPAAVRFVSCEPLLGPIDLFRGDLDWVIAGCESGPKRRPAETDWFRGLRDDCRMAGIPFFLKQMEVDGKLEKMPELTGKVWAQFPRWTE